MSNLCIIKILFEQMSQEASGLVSQAGTAQFVCPSVAELSVLVPLAPAGAAAAAPEPCLPWGPPIARGDAALWWPLLGAQLWGSGRRAGSLLALRLAPAVLGAHGFQGHVWLLWQGAVGRSWKAMGSVPGCTEAELRLPMCVGEVGQALALGAAAGCPGTTRLIGSPARRGSPSLRA